MNVEEIGNITAEMMKQALDEMADSCEENCVHAAAISANKKAVAEVIAEGEANVKQYGLDPLLQQFVSGLHVGYRLAQIELQQLSKGEN